MKTQQTPASKRVMLFKDIVWKLLSSAERIRKGNKSTCFYFILNDKSKNVGFITVDGTLNLVDKDGNSFEIKGRKFITKEQLKEAVKISYDFTHNKLRTIKP